MIDLPIKNKKSVRVIGIIVMVLSGAMGYITYANEPWETLAGVIFGIGFALFLFSYAVKKENK